MVVSKVKQFHVSPQIGSSDYNTLTFKITQEDHF